MSPTPVHGKCDGGSRAGPDRTGQDRTGQDRTVLSRWNDAITSVLPPPFDCCPKLHLALLALDSLLLIINTRLKLSTSPNQISDINACAASSRVDPPDL
jgi:hypothetical protein